MVNQKTIFEDLALPSAIQNYYRRYLRAKNALEKYDEHHWPFAQNREQVEGIKNILAGYLKESGHADILNNAA